MPVGYQTDKAKEVRELNQNAENGILRHGLGQRAANILIKRMAELDKEVTKLQKANKKLKGEFGTMAGQFRQAYADKMTDDMADGDYANRNKSS